MGHIRSMRYNLLVGHGRPPYGFLLKEHRPRLLLSMQTSKSQLLRQGFLAFSDFHLVQPQIYNPSGRSAEDEIPVRRFFAIRSCLLLSI